MVRVLCFILVPGLLAAQEPEQPPPPLQDSLFFRAWAEPAQCTKKRCALRFEQTDDGIWVVRGEPGNRVGRAPWRSGDFFEFGNSYGSDFRALEVAVASSPEAAMMVRAATSASRTRAGFETVFAWGGLGMLAVERSGTSQPTLLVAGIGAGLAAIASLVTASAWEISMDRRVAKAFRVYNESLPEAAVGESP